jgi:cytochrome c2
MADAKTGEKLKPVPPKSQLAPAPLTGAVLDKERTERNGNRTVTPYRYERSKEPNARGKQLFQTRGCLACHQHSAFPAAKEDQGPDLSHIGDKLAGKNGGNAERGRAWLYHWLQDPTNYHARTRMPNTFLVPYVEKEEEKAQIEEPNTEGGKAAKKKDGSADMKSSDEVIRTNEVKVDPALEIVEFLMASRAPSGSKFQGADVPGIDTLRGAMRDLALEHLQGGSGFTRSQALSYLDRGIPAELAPEIKGDEIELLQDKDGKFDSAQQLVYLGRRSISKYGCFGCHDVPGFESAKPIGTGLADWGRKETSKIAFEQITNYIGKTEPGLGHGHGHHLDLSGLKDEGKKYFLTSLEHHQREGFLWQKLRQPRSYDYEKTQNKKYNERLKMPRFRFHPDNPDGTESQENAQVREKVMTFVLGLVSEAPVEEYLYRPDPRRKAIAEGRVVLEKYNCGGCHTLEMQQWKVSLRAADFQRAKPYADEYSFLAPHFSAESLDRSQREDERGFQQVVLTGKPAIDSDTGNPLRRESDDFPGKFEVGIELWKPAAINGHVYRVGEEVRTFEENIQPLRPPVGGSLARLLPAAVIQQDQAKQAARQSSHASLEKKKTKDALSFGPPPLVNEGLKVQSKWLHDFLLDPYEIRPMAVLRMPKFNMSADEASTLVNYFAAMDGAEYPYAFDSRTRRDHLRREEQEFPGRLTDAKVFIQTKCLQCHKLGEFTPTRPDKAPNLADVYHRLRPEFLRHWLANPARMLPYTGMPVNIPPKEGPRDQRKAEHKGDFGAEVGALFDPTKSGATVEDQLGAVVDFLLNYDEYVQRNEKIEELKPPGGSEPGKDGKPPADAPAKGREPAKGPDPDAPDPAKGKEPAKPASK